MKLLFTSQFTQRKSWSTFIWIKLILWILEWLIGHLILRMTISALKKRIKKFLVLKYHSAIDTLMYFANCIWTYKSNSQLMGNTNAWYLSDSYQWRSETKFYSFVTTLLLHEDISSEQRCSNSWKKHISPKILLYM